MDPAEPECSSHEGSQNEPVEVNLELESLKKVIGAFRFYRYDLMRMLKRKQMSFASLSTAHRSLLPNFPAHIEALKLRAQHNYEVIKVILEDVDNIFENVQQSQLDLDGTASLQPSSRFDMDKVHITLKQINRDWGSEGQAERLCCYKPVLEALEKFTSGLNRSDCRVLVPGCGLGRLAFEIAQLGYEAQGNEFSYFMLITSNFILNRCKEPHQFTIYPWIQQSVNHYSNDLQLRSIRFPDVNPAELPPGSKFSMAAGEFVEVYKTQLSQWDVVVTVFFIDTAHNVIEYVETINNCLKPGGIWINLGPLLYHFADTDEISLELSYEDLKSVVGKMGFVQLEEKIKVPCSYTQNAESMLKYQYDCAFTVYQKK